MSSSGSLDLLRPVRPVAPRFAADILWRSGELHDVVRIKYNHGGGEIVYDTSLVKIMMCCLCFQVNIVEGKRGVEGAKSLNREVPTTRPKSRLERVPLYPKEVTAAGV